MKNIFAESDDDAASRPASLLERQAMLLDAVAPLCRESAVDPASRPEPGEVAPEPPE